MDLTFKIFIMTTTIILIFTAALMIALGVMMGWAIRLYLVELPFNKEIANTQLHFWGWLVRVTLFAFSIILLIILKQPWHFIIWSALLFLFMSWAPWDIFINLINKRHWTYSGSISSNTSSRIDKLLNNFDEYLKGALLLLVIAWYPLNFPETIEKRGLSLAITVVVAAISFYGVIRFSKNK